MSENNANAAINAFIRANRMHKCLIDSNVCSKIGLHRSQHIILMHLSRRDRLPSQKELANHLGITQAAVTGALKKLECGGYIERTVGTDNRYNEIKITELGRDVVKKTQKIFADIDNAIFKNFTEEEILKFIELNLKIQNNIQLLADGGDI